MCSFVTHVVFFLSAKLELLTKLSAQLLNNRSPAFSYSPWLALLHSQGPRKPWFFLANRYKVYSMQQPFFFFFIIIIIICTAYELNNVIWFLFESPPGKIYAYFTEIQLYALIMVICRNTFRRKKWVERRRNGKSAEKCVFDERNDLSSPKLYSSAVCGLGWSPLLWILFRKNSIL
jgi:hypothetical protein